MAVVESLRFRTIARPLLITFATARGSKEVLRSVLVSVRLRDGTVGRGEIPTSASFPREDIPSIAAALRRVAPTLRGATEGDWRERVVTLRKVYSEYPMTLSGIEVALFRAFLSSAGSDEHRYWGAVATEITTDLTIPFLGDRERLRGWIRNALGKGFVSFKVKMSGDIDADKRLLLLVGTSFRDSPHPVRLRLDCNQGYRAGTFLKLCDAIERYEYPVELVEQPLARKDLKGLRQIRGRSPAPVILDESILSPDDLRPVIDGALADGVNIKVAKSGIAGSEEIYRLAREAGMRLMIGCMMETMTGLSAAIFLASGKGDFDYVDLDAVHFYRRGGRFGRIGIDGPRYRIRGADPGGVSPP